MGQRVPGLDRDRFGWSGLLPRCFRVFYLEVPFKDVAQLNERLVHVGDGNLLAEGVRADVAQLANGIGVGVQPVGEEAVLDESLQQVFQGACAGRFVDAVLVHIPDDVLQHLAGTGQCHFRVKFSDQDGLLHAVP